MMLRLTVNLDDATPLSLRCRIGPSAERINLFTQALSIWQRYPMDRRVWRQPSCVKLIAAILVFILLHLGHINHVNAATLRHLPLPSALKADFSPFQSWEEALAARADLSRQSERRTRDAVTLAYAVLELKTHFKLLGVEMTVVGNRTPNKRAAVILEIDPNARLESKNPTAISFGSQAHRLEAGRDGVRITARTGVGALYGAYSLLEALGFDWPDVETLVAPSPDAAKSALRNMQDQTWVPAQEYRGFWVYEPARTDIDFFVWMARKKFNVGPGTSPSLRTLLGIYAWGGGHHLIEEVFSEDGLFEKHPDWFSRIRFFKRPVSKSDSPFNPSFSSKAAAIYFADRLAERLENGDLKNFDILNVWQVDSFARSFDEGLRSWWTGNESDNILLFYSNVVDRLSKHIAAGRLSRKVIIAGASYGPTMEPPKYAESVKQLESKPYLHLFYPIERDRTALAGGTGDSTSNRRIMTQIRTWKSFASLNFGVVDYHNMSSYGGLVTTDHLKFQENYSALSQGGMALYSYMHVLSGDPGPRRLTHALAARLGWICVHSSETGPIEKPAEEDVLEEYFTDRFKTHAKEWRRIYDLMDRATSNANEIFGTDSLHLLAIQQIAWEDPPYSTDEVRRFVHGFQTGGKQLRPGRFYGEGDYLAEFVGIQSSIAQIDEAMVLGSVAAAKASEPSIIHNMKSDLAWLESTRLRYQAMMSLSQFLLAQPGTKGRAVARRSLVESLAELERSPQLWGALSPVNQVEFAKQYRQMLSLPGNEI